MAQQRHQQASGLGTTALTLAVGIGVGCWLSGSRRWHKANDAPAAVDLDATNEPDAEEMSPSNFNASSGLCICGFDLTGKRADAVRKHLNGRQHRVNLYRAGKPILVTAKVNEYRAAIATHVLPTDVILEVGCAEGLTAQRLAQRCRVAIGVDLHEKLINKGRARLQQGQPALAEGESPSDTNGMTIPNWSNLHLHAADAFDTRAIIKIVDDALRLTTTANDTDATANNNGVQHDQLHHLSSPPGTSSKEKATTPTYPMSKKEKRDLRRKQQGGDKSGREHAGKVNKIWIDISGSRELRTVVHLISVLESLFQPDLIVVKSHHMKDVVLRSYLPSSNIPGISNTPIETPYVLR